MFVMRISEERVLLINVRMRGKSETGFWRRGFENIGDTLGLNSIEGNILYSN